MSYQIVAMPDIFLGKVTSLLVINVQIRRGQNPPPALNRVKTREPKLCKTCRSKYYCHCYGNFMFRGQ